MSGGVIYYDPRQGPQDEPSLTLREFLFIQHSIFAKLPKHARAAMPEGLSKLLLNRKHSQLAKVDLHKACIIHVGADVFGEVVKRAEGWVLENIALVEPDDEVELDDAGFLDKVVRPIGSQVAEAPWPDKLPFESVFLGYGSGWALDPLLTHCKGYAQAARGGSVRIMGHLLSSSGRCFEVSVVDRGDIEQAQFEPLRTWDGLRWTCGFDFLCWAIPMLVEVINQYRSFVFTHEFGDDQLREYLKKYRHRKLSKAVGRNKLLPPPFYRIRLKDTFHIEDAAQKAIRELFPKTRSLRFRHDRRGHERCYVRRGEMPLEPDKSMAMRRNGYTVYTDATPSAEDAKRLLDRRMASKCNDEWLAIKTCWIDAQVVGDSSLPYIPALRYVKNLAEARRRMKKAGIK